MRTGHKKSDILVLVYVLFIPINVARFTFEKHAGLHVKCPSIMLVFDTVWMHCIC
jgi:hypothetical protein